MRKIMPLGMAMVAAGAVVAFLPAANPQPAQAFALGVHENLTAEALSFLAQGPLGQINDEHLYVDTRHQLDPKQHFDSCTFSDGANHINGQYLSPGGSAEKGVVAEFKSGASRVFEAADEFGQLLHPSQDFYAHSNWVEIGRRDLLDNSLGPWPLLAQWTEVRPGVIIVGKDLPSSWTASNAGDMRVPTITTHTGQTAKALMSGKGFDNGQCYPPISLGHWESGGLPGLHKDDNSRQFFAEARELGVRQTQHEWCRMLHLTKGSGGDFAAASIPMALWVKSGSKPHPTSTPCSNPTRGDYNVTIAMKKVKVLNDEDPALDGEINLNVGGYLKDFKDSALAHIGPMKMSNGDSVPANKLNSLKVTLSCVQNPQNVVATLQGWDDDLGTDGQLEDLPGDPDDLLSGMTVAVPGGEGTSLVNATSSSLDVTFEITRTRVSNC